MILGFHSANFFPKTQESVVYSCVMNCLHFSPLFRQELGSPSRAGDPPPEAWRQSATPLRLRCVDTFRGYVGSLVTRGHRWPRMARS